MCTIDTACFNECSLFHVITGVVCILMKLIQNVLFKFYFDCLLVDGLKKSKQTKNLHLNLCFKYRSNLQKTPKKETVFYQQRVYSRLKRKSIFTNGNRFRNEERLVYISKIESKSTFHFNCSGLKENLCPNLFFVLNVCQSLIYTKEQR